MRNGAELVPGSGRGVPEGPARDPIDDAQHPGCDIVDVGEIASVVTVIEDIDRETRENVRVNRNSAMSGRPHGPYTVKNRKPVVGNRNNAE